MMKRLCKSKAAWAAISLMLGTAALAQGTQLAAPADRISDKAIQADHQAYETLQGRIKGLNDKGRPVRDYHLAKAQCWLDVSFHEYTRNDRSAFPQAAMTEAEKLIVGMEQGGALGQDTPLVNNAARLRPDLWERAGKLKGHAGYRCVQQKVACAEVELVHAGNEHNQQQWRHAKPYVQIAEDLIGDAESHAAACPPPPTPIVAPVVVAPPPPPPPPPPPLREVTLGANVVFNFDRSGVGDMRSHSVGQIEQLTQRIKRENLEVLSVRLTGHADRLNGTRKADYNQQLSERRVQTVRDELVRQGVEAKLINITAMGDRQQVESCGARFSSPTDLRECLLPNRRVEIEIVARQRR